MKTKYRRTKHHKWESWSKDVVPPRCHQIYDSIWTFPDKYNFLAVVYKYTLLKLRAICGQSLQMAGYTSDHRAERQARVSLNFYGNGTSQEYVHQRPRNPRETIRMRIAPLQSVENEKTLSYLILCALSRRCVRNTTHNLSAPDGSAGYENPTWYVTSLNVGARPSNGGISRMKLYIKESVLKLCGTNVRRTARIVR